MSRLIVKSFAVAVDGFPTMTWVAKTRGQALARAWDSYRSFQSITFKDFLKIARSWRTASPEGFGRPITVCGQPGFWIGDDGHRVRFVRPDCDVVLNSHPLDVEPRHD